jgi:hypothetical protein
MIVHGVHRANIIYICMYIHIYVYTDVCIYICMYIYVRHTFFGLLFPFSLYFLAKSTIFSHRNMK